MPEEKYELSDFHLNVIHQFLAEQIHGEGYDAQAEARKEFEAQMDLLNQGKFALEQGLHFDDYSKASLERYERSSDTPVMMVDDPFPPRVWRKVAAWLRNKYIRNSFGGNLRDSAQIAYTFARMLWKGNAVYSPQQAAFALFTLQSHRAAQRGDFWPFKDADGNKLPRTDGEAQRLFLEACRAVYMKEFHGR